MLDRENNSNIITPIFNLLKPIFILTLFLAILTVGGTDFSAGANGNVIYVNSTGGSDANDGLTPATAKLTISNATGTVARGGTVHVADGTYKGTKNRGITLDKSMSILGQSRLGTIIDAQKKNRIFIMANGVTVNLKNLTITNGYTAANGGAIFNNGKLTVTDSTFTGNSAHNTNIGGANGNGGAIENKGTLTVIGSTFTGNSARNDVKGVAALSKDIAGGGAIVNNLGTVTITGSTFTGNLADVNGGAIVNNRGTMHITSGVFTSNLAHGGGGALLNGDGTMRVMISTFNRNRAGGDNGGAIVNGFGKLTLIESTFNSNTAHDGGGAVLNGFGVIDVIGSTFNRNTADGKNGNGGAIVNGGRLVTVIRSIFTGNLAREGGGAILNGGGILDVSRSLFEGNRANQNGGAILNVGRNLKVTTTTFTRNHAAGKGGAIFNDFAKNGTGPVSVVFKVLGSDITYNTASSGGAIYNNKGIGWVHFNRIIANQKKDIVSPKDLVDARFNWWGRNANPQSRVSGNVMVTPWLVLRITADPLTLGVGDTSIIIVDILHDSNGAYHPPNQSHVPDGIRVVLTATNGIISALQSEGGGTVSTQVVYLVNGRAQALFTLTGEGAAVISAVVDSQEVQVVINAAGGDNGDKIPMQDTGTPLYALYVAILAVLGGLVVSSRRWEVKNFH